MCAAISAETGIFIYLAPAFGAEHKTIFYHDLELKVTLAGYFITIEEKIILIIRIDNF